MSSIDDVDSNFKSMSIHDEDDSSDELDEKIGKSKGKKGKGKKGKKSKGKKGKGKPAGTDIISSSFHYDHDREPEDDNPGSKS